MQDTDNIGEVSVGEARVVTTQTTRVERRLGIGLGSILFHLDVTGPEDESSGVTPAQAGEWEIERKDLADLCGAMISRSPCGQNNQRYGVA